MLTSTDKTREKAFRNNYTKAVTKHHGGSIESLVEAAKARTCGVIETPMELLDVMLQINQMTISQLGLYMVALCPDNPSPYKINLDVFNCFEPTTTMLEIFQFLHKAYTENRRTKKVLDIYAELTNFTKQTIYLFREDSKNGKICNTRFLGIESRNAAGLAFKYYSSSPELLYQTIQFCFQDEGACDYERDFDNIDYQYTTNSYSIAPVLEDILKSNVSNQAKYYYQYMLLVYPFIAADHYFPLYVERSKMRNIFSQI